MVKLSETTLVNSKIVSLLEAQLSSIETIKQSVQEIGRNTTEAIYRKTLEDWEASANPGSRLERRLISQETPPSMATDLCTNLADTPTDQKSYTNMFMLSTQRAGVETSDLLCGHTFGDHTQSSGFSQKIDRVGISIGAIEGSLKNFSIASAKLDLDAPKSEVERAAQNFLKGIWLLLSSLQLLIHELV